MDEKLQKNYIYHIIYRLSICILPLIVTPYVARVLGAENNGLYAFSSTIACYFIMLGKLGLENYGSRTIAPLRGDRYERSRNFWSIYALQVITSLIAIILYVGTIFSFFDGHVVYLMQLIYVISVLFDVSWFFYGMEEFRITTIRSLISRFLLIIAVFIFVTGREDLWIFTALMAVSFLLEQLMLFPFVFKHVDFVKTGWKDLLGHVKPNFKLFIPLLALSINNWMDKIMLGVIDGNSSVAYYNYAESIINLPKGIVVALGTVMLPIIAPMAVKGITDSFKRIFEGSMGLITLIACGLCFGIAGVAPLFVPLFLGNEYLRTILLTIELAVVMIPLGMIDVIQTQYLIPFKKENIYIISVLLGAFANLVLNIMLIPRWGASGAVIGTLGATMAMAFYQIYRIRHILPLGKLLSIVTPFIICGMGEFAIIYLIGKFNMHHLLLLFMQIAAGGLVYLAGCLVFYLIFKPQWMAFWVQRREGEGT